MKIEHSFNIIHQQLHEFYEIKLKLKYTNLLSSNIDFHATCFYHFLHIQNNHHNRSTKINLIQQQFHEKARTNMPLKSLKCS